MTNIEQALAFIGTASPEVPFWPQLPRRGNGDDFVQQFLAPVAELLSKATRGKRLKVTTKNRTRLLRRLSNSPSHPESDPDGFAAFREAVASDVFPDAVMFKAQVTGPLTLGMCIEMDGHPIAHDPAALRALTIFVADEATRQARALALGGRPVLVFVDEPCLPQATELPGGVTSVIDALVWINARIRAAGAIAGVHCCAAILPELLCQTQPNVISFDADRHVEQFLDDDAVRAFIRHDGWLGFGMVPTSGDLTKVDASTLFMRWLSAVRAAGHDLSRVARQTLITASCGLGLLDEQSAETSFRLARQLSQRVAAVGAAL